MVTRSRRWGELEGELLRLLQAEGEPVGARHLQGLFSPPVPAYTTVMTALTRLEHKGRVVRVEQSPRKVRFAVARPDGEDAGASMISMLEQTGDRKAALLAFAGNLDAQDIALLRSAFAEERRSR